MINVFKSDETKPLILLSKMRYRQAQVLVFLSKTRGCVSRTLVLLRKSRLGLTQLAVLLRKTKAPGPSDLKNIYQMLKLSTKTRNLI